MELMFSLRHEVLKKEHENTNVYYYYFFFVNILIKEGLQFCSQDYFLFGWDRA